MLKATNISKTYKIKVGKGLRKSIRYIEAVKDVSLFIEPGKIVGLLGVNGAGKTTTIKMLTTMIEPSSGSINIDGIDAVRNHFEAKKIINLITGGERNIYWRLTARENLAYFGSLYGIPKKILESRIQQIIEIVDLKDAIDIPVERYSKGMKQRLQIARGLINDPRYLFLDEPTLGLDIIIANELREYVAKLAKEQNKGILLTTHNIFEAEDLCDYIYIIDHGKIIMEGIPSVIKNKYRKSYNVQFYLENITPEVISKLRELCKDSQIQADMENNMIEISSPNNIITDVINTINFYEIKLVQLVSKEPNLEDILLSVFKNGGEYGE